MRRYKMVVSYPEGAPGMEVRAHDELNFEVEAEYIERDRMFIGEGKPPWTPGAHFRVTIDGKAATKLVVYPKDGQWVVHV